jgi:hypothetical protein
VVVSCRYANRRRIHMTRPACSIAGCGNLVHSRGWCVEHYKRWYNHGDPSAVTLRVAGNLGPVRVPLSSVAPDKRAMAWACQVRFDAAIAKLR